MPPYPNNKISPDNICGKAPCQNPLELPYKNNLRPFDAQVRFFNGWKEYYESYSRVTKGAFIITQENKDLCIKAIEGSRFYIVVEKMIKDGQEVKTAKIEGTISDCEYVDPYKY